jgi:hypothetical protein
MGTTNVTAIPIGEISAMVYGNELERPEPR